MASNLQTIEGKYYTVVHGNGTLISHHVPAIVFVHEILNSSDVPHVSYVWAGKITKAVYAVSPLVMAADIGQRTEDKVDWKDVAKQIPSADTFVNLIKICASMSEHAKYKRDWKLFALTAMLINYVRHNYGDAVDLLKICDESVREYDLPDLYEEIVPRLPTIATKLIDMVGTDQSAIGTKLFFENYTPNENAL